jgi:glycosyltransferase involved in cell wall biosynthesis
MSAQSGNRRPAHRLLPGAPRGSDPGQRNLVMVPAWPGQLACHELARLASAGERPRTDYVELARELDADVMDMEYMDSRATRLARSLARHVGLPTAQVAEAFLRRGEYAHVVARADRLGLPLALLHKVFRGDGDVVLVSGWLSRPRKAVFLRPLHVHTHLLAIVNYSSVQMSIAAERLHVPPGKLHHALQPVDLRFWQRVEPPTEDTIAAAGYEARDYATLLEAVRGSKVRTELAVGTTVFASGDISAELSPALRPLAQAPPNVTIHQQLSHLQLRALYARSRFVVVPLQDVEFDAGVTTIAEAMAMGKAVVVTRSRGQVDLVRHGTTGLYVPPGDPRALRQAIDHLMAHPEEAARMGREGRAYAEENLSLDQWVSRVAGVTLAS